MIKLVSSLRSRPLLQSCSVHNFRIFGCHFKGDIQINDFNLYWFNFATTSLTAAIVVSTGVHWIDKVAYHDVVRLQISMTDIVTVHVLCSLEELLHDTSHYVFAQNLNGSTTILVRFN